MFRRSLTEGREWFALPQLQEPDVAPVAPASEGKRAAARGEGQARAPRIRWLIRNGQATNGPRARVQHVEIGRLENQEPSAVRRAAMGDSVRSMPCRVSEHEPVGVGDSPDARRVVNHPRHEDGDSEVWR